jgi:hypothetical protein
MIQELHRETRAAVALSSVTSTISNTSNGSDSCNSSRSDDDDGDDDEDGDGHISMVFRPPVYHLSCSKRTWFAPRRACAH